MRKYKKRDATHPFSLHKMLPQLKKIIDSQNYNLGTLMPKRHLPSPKLPFRKNCDIFFQNAMEFFSPKRDVFQALQET